MSKIWEFIRKHRFFIILLFSAIIFFFIYSFLIFGQVFSKQIYGPEYNGSRIILNSPDETANFFFSKLYAEDNTLSVFEPLEFISNNLVKPRSVKVINGYLVPGSFLGMILIYGIIAKIFSIGVINFLTPLIAVIAVLFFYGLVKEIFDSKIAFVSAWLLFIHPAFWYYSCRGLLPNVLLISLLIIAFYFILISFKNYSKNYWNWVFTILAGIFMGLALTVRPTEYVWIMLILLILAIFYFKKIEFTKLVVFVSVIFLIFLPIFYFDTILYSQPYLTGYSLADTIYPLKTTLEEVKITTNFEVLKPPPLNEGYLKYIYPFAFNLKNIVKNFIFYYVKFFWWLNILWVLGLIFYLINYRKEKGKIIYLVIFFLITIWLVLYYATWLFFDNVTPQRVTIGNSYIRYWLPSFIMSLPLISVLIISLSKIKYTILKIFLVSFVFFAVVFFNAEITFWKGEESLVQALSNLVEYQVKADKVLSLTPADALIITNRSDKLFFPLRKVAYYINNDFTLINHLPRLLEKMPIYWFTMMPQKDIDYLNYLLGKHNLVLTNPVEIIGVEKLWQVNQLSNQ